MILINSHNRLGKCLTMIGVFFAALALSSCARFDMIDGKTQNSTDQISGDGTEQADAQANRENFQPQVLDASISLEEDEELYLVTQSYEGTEVQPFLELVLAMDTSWSMHQEKKQLEQNLKRFIDRLIELNVKFRMNILGNPHKFDFPDDYSSDLLEIHKTQVNESNAIQMLSNFVKDDLNLRPEADLHYIFVSDSNAKGNGNRQADLYVPKGFKHIVHAIVGLQKAYSSYNGCKIVAVGQEFIDLAKTTQGTVLDVCAKDWEAMVVTLADSIKNRVERDFELDFNPEEEKPVQIKLNGRILAELRDSNVADDQQEGYRIVGSRLILTQATQFAIGDKIDVIFRPNQKKKSKLSKK